jgi:arylsulfatase A-like enzyme
VNPTPLMVMLRTISLRLARLVLAVGVAFAGVISSRAATPTDRRPPNIIVILAEDLGYGDLGCFGQKQFTTPRLDAMAGEGMRLTQFYAGSAVGAPSRCVLLTGRHTGRAVIRGTSTKPIFLQPGQPTMASLLRTAGYATACVGKWGVGTPDNLTNPNDVGFDHFFGYVNTLHAQNSYPEFLVRNGKVERLKNEVSADWKKWQDPQSPGAGRGVATRRVEYAPDLFTEDALRFIREHQKRPFFLVLAPNLPQANHDAGERGMEVPDLGEFASRDWPEPEKAFAAMLRNLDRDTGRVLDLLKELGLAKDTLVIFTSANGPFQGGGHQADFFDSNGKFRGSKGDLAEGGIRVPMIAWWPDTIPAGTENDRQWYLGDLMATAAELAGTPPPAGLDSDSLVSALKGHVEKDQWKRKSRLYWETYEGASAQAVRFGKWKAIRSPMFTGELELYDLSNDFAEKRSYAARRPDLARHATRLLDESHQPDPNWQVPAATQKPAEAAESR